MTGLSKWKTFVKYFQILNIYNVRLMIKKYYSLLLIILPKLSTLKITDASGSKLEVSEWESEDRFLEFKNEASKRNITYDIIVNRIEGDNRYGRYTPNTLIFTTLFIWIDNKHTLD